MQRHLLPFLILPLLAACQNSDVRNALGLEREAPDEFVVYSRPPLSMPPEFQLRPPTPGKRNFQDTDTRSAARGAVFGEQVESEAVEGALAEPLSDTAVAPVIASDAKTPAESNFLTRSGAHKATPDIREILSKSETAASPEDSKTLFNSIIKAEGQEPIVDASKEVQRLRKNKQADAPVTEGDVPTLDPTPKTVLEKIF